MSTENYIKIIILFLLSLNLHAAQTVTCDVQAEPLSFGIYDAYIQKPNDSMAYINYHCQGSNTNYSKVVISLSKGTSPNYNRYIPSQGEKIFYNLYLDYQKNQVWGDDTENTISYSAPLILDSWVKIPVYGRIFPGQEVHTGVFAVAVTATIELQ